MLANAQQFPCVGLGLVILLYLWTNNGPHADTRAHSPFMGQIRNTNIDEGR